MTYDSLNNLRPLLLRLPPLINLVLVVAIGLTTARLFWVLWPTETSAFPTVNLGKTAAVERVPVDINAITAVHLFGQSAKPDTSGQNKIIHAPETRLDLVLTGVVASTASETGRSRALIKHNGEQEAYAVGDIITRNVKLHAIYPTYVILDRGGRYETLTLKQLKTKEDRVERVATNTLPEDIGATLAAVRQKILRNPSTITKYIRLQPAKRNGELIGYRIYPGPNRALFQKIGLQPGVIVTKVNGLSLTTPQKAMKALNKLASAPRITVTLKSGNNQRTISVDFK